MASVLTTAIPAAASNIQSAASAAETAAINEIEALIPINCSLGTKQFCIGFTNHTKCNDLPFNVSNIILEAATSFVGNEIQALQPLEGILAKVMPANIQGCSILALVLILVMATIFFSVAFKIISLTTYLQRLEVCKVHSQKA